ncbi:hypothetical protein CFC21_081517 [Triticum aestivum]|uniref:RING-type E3 ubiquitin transferase n=2 Tax=Triticum aestivum TaxID=4565 RepID=A0A9R1L413_WHEAT|nr:U-box domain-containing protein 52-like [Triticum aestivum]KAF7076916.1 hypothetical protein CFC21_081517 [Triticum aestivum]
MAAEGDEEGAAAPKMVGLALSGPKSSAYVLRWALRNFAQDDAPPAEFKLIHVLTPVLAVPTPLGHLLPIDEVSNSVAEGELEKMWIEKQEMLQRCKDTCDENKVEAQVLLVEGKDVADTISSLVSQYQIHNLVIGNPPSKSPFTRRSTASRTACKICKCLPSFCTAYVVSKDGLSSVHVPESESGSPSGSPVPKGNSGSSSTKEFTDGTSSRSDLDGSSAPGLPSFTLNDYLTGNAPVYADKERRIASRTGAESSILSQFRGSDKVPTSSLQELMLSDNKDDVSTELGKLNLEPSHNRLLATASKDADRESRLEKPLVLPSDSYSMFTWEEIDNATASFSLKIGTGSNGTVYKGHLNHLDVAIKVLHSDDKSSTRHFNQELEVLSKIRHPHLLMLLGACPDRGCLVYEYMENGSLADRLQRRKGTPPIPWFDRFRIAWEIGSALVFLHSTKPSPIIHRDLKPENVLLDRNLVSKIGDVGLSTLMPPKETLSNRTVYKKTGLAGTLFYLDPEYQRTGQVSVKSDTYALGMVILELLTARCPIGLPEVVEQAVEDGQISNVLDESAGDWPVREAHDLAQLGLNCLEMRSKDRPDLNSVVLEELGRLKRIAASVSGVALPGSPSHFKCPILKTVMYDPCIASDGYTYERSAMEMWLCDKDVSPVTKARLRDKTLLPNLSLKSAIVRWVADGGRPVKE